MLKRSIIIAAVLFALLLGSCGSSTGPWAMRLEYNGRTSEFSTNIYSFYMSNTMTRELINMFAMMGVPAENVPAMFVSMRNMADWDEDEFNDMMRSYADANMMRMLGVVAYCREHNLTLDADQRESVDQFIRTLIREVFGGSRTDFNNTLARFGINEDIFREIRRHEAMTGLVNRHIFDPETGTRPISMEDIMSIYEPNFARFKHVLIVTPLPFDLDVEGNLVELPEQAAARSERASDIYNQASGSSAEVFEQLINNYSEDIHGRQQMPHGFTISEGSGFPENLTQAVFDMRIGDVRMLETDAGIHIIRKYELMPPEQTLDLSNPGNSVAQTITRTFQYIFLMEELEPYMANITFNREETDKFTTRTTDTMFDVWGWIDLR